MSKFQELLAKKAVGMLGGGADSSGEEPGVPPFILNLLKSFGITPERIMEFAEGFKNAVVERLNHIDDQINQIKQMQANMSMLLEAIEHDLRGKDTEPIPQDIFPPDAQPAFTTDGTVHKEDGETHQPEQVN